LGFVIRSTTFSEDRVYRYTLWRDWWRDDLPRPLCRDCADSTVLGVCDHDGSRCDPSDYVQFIGLNPSTADEVKDDNTIRCCRNYAKRWGYGAICMTNLFAFRATDPRDMKKAKEPIGPDNDEWLLKISGEAALVVAVWGTHGSHLGRAAQVLKCIPSLHVLSKNADGSPHHPLYLSADLKPLPI
jgi:hypothetical protein